MTKKKKHEDAKREVTEQAIEDISLGKNEGQENENNESAVEESTSSLKSLVEENEKLKALIEELKEENAKLKDAALRATADFYNYRQRVEREKEKLSALATEKTIKELLPVLDNLDRALSANDNDDAEKIKSGIRIIRKQFMDVMCKLGLEPIESEGKDFDPSVHEALAAEEVEPELDGKVLEEYQKGFVLGGKVLRAAKVKVGKSTSTAEETKKNE